MHFLICLDKNTLGGLPFLSLNLISRCHTKCCMQVINLQPADSWSRFMNHLAFIWVFFCNINLTFSLFQWRQECFELNMCYGGPAWFTFMNSCQTPLLIRSIRVPGFTYRTLLPWPRRHSWKHKPKSLPSPESQTADQSFSTQHLQTSPRSHTLISKYHLQLTSPAPFTGSQNPSMDEAGSDHSEHPAQPPYSSRGIPGHRGAPRAFLNASSDGDSTAPPSNLCLCSVLSSAAAAVLCPGPSAPPAASGADPAAAVPAREEPWQPLGSAREEPWHPPGPGPARGSPACLPCSPGTVTPCAPMTSGSLRPVWAENPHRY